MSSEEWRAFHLEIVGKWKAILVEETRTWKAFSLLMFVVGCYCGIFLARTLEILLR